MDQGRLAYITKQDWLGHAAHGARLKIACIIIASAKRRELLEKQVLPSVICQPFNEIVVVGDYKSGLGYRHIPYPPLTGSTIDAQFKRDIGTLATSAEWLVYLCDDHRLDADFATSLRKAGPDERTVGVPARYTVRGNEVIGLNMGIPGYMGKDYCGGHSGIYHRSAIQQVPWTLAPLHPNWDYYHSRILVERGYKLVELPECRIEDIEPNAEPWN